MENHQLTEVGRNRGKRNNGDTNNQKQQQEGDKTSLDSNYYSRCKWIEFTNQKIQCAWTEAREDPNIC